MPRPPTANSSREAKSAFKVYHRAATEAATAMASLMGASVQCEPLAQSTIESELSGLSASACATSFALSGGTAGTLVVAASGKDAAMLAERLLGAPPSVPLDSRARGAFDEVGNIVASQFLNAVASVLGVSCLPSVPYAHTGDGAALVDSILEAHPKFAASEAVSAHLVVDGRATLRLVHAPASGANAEIAARLNAPSFSALSDASGTS